MGDDLNIKEKEEQEQEKIKEKAGIRNEKYEIKLTSPGNSLYNFGKLLVNAAFGQTLMANHDEQIESINDIDQQYEFMDENDLDRIITNDEDPDGYHVFIGTKKWMKQKI